MLDRESISSFVRSKPWDLIAQAMEVRRFPSFDRNFGSLLTLTSRVAADVASLDRLAMVRRRLFQGSATLAQSTQSVALRRWATITAATVMVRLCIFPLYVQHLGFAARVSAGRADGLRRFVKQMKTGLLSQHFIAPDVKALTVRTERHQFDPVATTPSCCSA
jgi:hypothetical protein